MTTAAEMMAPGNYPSLSVRPMEAPNRFWAIPILGIVLKGIILIPVGIWLYILMLVLIVVALINSLQVFFTGHYWETAYNLGLGILRLETKVGLYVVGFTDRYPGFSLDIPSDELFALDMAMPDAPSRGFAIPVLGGIARVVMLIPFVIWAEIVGYAAFLAMVVASFAVLSSGRYPVSLFELVRDAMRLSLSTSCYTLGLSDSYPSFEISMNHPGVKWLFIALGILLMLANLIQSLASSAQRH